MAQPDLDRSELLNLRTVGQDQRHSGYEGQLLAPHEGTVMKFCARVRNLCLHFLLAAAVVASGAALSWAFRAETQFEDRGGAVIKVDGVFAPIGMFRAETAKAVPLPTDLSGCWNVGVLAPDSASPSNGILSAHWWPREYGLCFSSTGASYYSTPYDRTPLGRVEDSLDLRSL